MKGVTRAYTLNKFRLTYLSSLAQAKPDTPTFTVNAGDVVYVGDLIVDVSVEAMAILSVKSSESEVRKVLSERGYSGELIFRQIQQFDGKPVNKSHLFAKVLQRQ